jgi:hypothetical protein
MKINDLDIITKYLQASFEQQELFVLTESQQELLERMEQIHDWLKQEKSKKHIVEQLQTTYHVHQATAYRLVERAYTLYDVRQILIDNTLAELQKTKTAAIQVGDIKAASNADKNRIHFIEKFFGESKPQQQQTVQITIGNFPELTGVQLPPEKDLKAFVERIRSLKESQEVKTYSLPSIIDSPHTELDQTDEYNDYND